MSITGNKYYIINSKLAESQDIRHWQLKLRASDMDLREQRYRLMEFLHDREQNLCEKLRNQVTSMLKKICIIDKCREEPITELTTCDTQEARNPLFDPSYTNITDDIEKSLNPLYDTYYTDVTDDIQELFSAIPYTDVTEDLIEYEKEDYSPAYWKFESLGPLRITKEPTLPPVLDEDIKHDDDDDTIMIKFLNQEENRLNKNHVSMVQRENAMCRCIAINRALIRSCERKRKWLLENYGEYFKE